MNVLQRTVRFCEQLATVVPDAHVYYRRGLALKKVIPQCVARNFTYLMVINEDRKVPSILCHLCEGVGGWCSMLCILFYVILYL